MSDDLTINAIALVADKYHITPEEAVQLHQDMEKIYKEDWLANWLKWLDNPRRD